MNRTAEFAPFDRIGTAREDEVSLAKKERKGRNDARCDVVDDNLDDH